LTLAEFACLPDGRCNSDSPGTRRSHCSLRFPTASKNSAG